MEKTGRKERIISLIVACGENNVIGRENDMIWHLPRDLRFFKEKTIGHHLIMGRKTFEACGGPLPDRTNIVVTRDPNYEAPGCTITNSLEEAIELVENDDEPFIVGGEEIYRQALGAVDRIYLTRVHHTFSGDTFFPELNKETWQEVEKEAHPPDDKHPYPFTFITLERKKE